MPTAFMKPLSGSGARGAMVETINNFGVESFPAKLAGTLQGSTETTFYTLAVYYGAVNIRNTRYTAQAGRQILLALWQPSSLPTRFLVSTTAIA